jgi:outer membrane protein TolC
MRQAQAQWRAASERIGVSAASVDMAEESLRITKNRFDAGLTTVTELLRSEIAVHEARMRRLLAVYDQRVAAAQTELAAGTLSENSNALQ